MTMTWSGQEFKREMGGKRGSLCDRQNRPHIAKRTVKNPGWVQILFWETAYLSTTPALEALAKLSGFPNTPKGPRSRWKMQIGRATWRIHDAWWGTCRLAMLACNSNCNSKPQHEFPYAHCTIQTLHGDQPRCLTIQPGAMSKPCWSSNRNLSLWFLSNSAVVERKRATNTPCQSNRNSFLTSEKLSRNNKCIIMHDYTKGEWESIKTNHCHD